jgi:hypothetical protein
MTSQEGRKPTFAEALIILLVCAGIISYGVLKLGVDAHIPIITSAVIVALWGCFGLKYPWKTIEEGMLQGNTMALQAIVILMMVGSSSVPGSKAALYRPHLLRARHPLSKSLSLRYAAHLFRGKSCHGNLLGNVRQPWVSPSWESGQDSAFPPLLPAGVVISGAISGTKCPSFRIRQTSHPQLPERTCSVTSGPWSGPRSHLPHRHGSSPSSSA